MDTRKIYTGVINYTNQRICLVVATSPDGVVFIELAETNEVENLKLRLENEGFTDIASVDLKTCDSALLVLRLGRASATLLYPRPDL